MQFGANNRTLLIAWVRTQVSGADAAALHRLGVTPDDVGWSYEDRGSHTLADRLRFGDFTVEQVALEVEGRRIRASS